jgi:threonine/homoserine/homoserine lactone efflux protein
MTLIPIAFPLLSAAIALLAAIPLGPVNMEIIRRVLNRHKLSAFKFGAGAAAADGLWPLVVFMGFTPLLEIRWVAVLFWGVSALILLILGTNFIRDAFVSHHDQTKVAPKQKRRFAPIAGFLLVISNPTNLVTWAAVIGIFHGQRFLPARTALSGWVLWFSVAVGTFAYFTILILLVNHYHSFFINPKRLRVLKIFFGSLILAIAVYFSFHLVQTIQGA